MHSSNAGIPEKKILDRKTDDKKSGLFSVNQGAGGNESFRAQEFVNEHTILCSSSLTKDRPSYHISGVPNAIEPFKFSD